MRRTRLRLEDILRILEELEIESLENIEIEAERIEIEIPFSTYARIRALEEIVRGEELEEVRIEPPKLEWSGEIERVRIGATREMGGTRGWFIEIGGVRNLPFITLGEPNLEMPKITADVFDTRMKLPRPIRDYYEDVMDDPVAWAKRSLGFGADLITIHLVSTDPRIKDTSPEDAASLVSDLVREIESPLVIGGSGNPDKDPDVLSKVAEECPNERFLLASASLNNDYRRIARAARENGHAVLAWTQLSIPDQKTLNKHLLREGLPRDSLVMDPTLAALGYGFEYSISILERLKISGLSGDRDLAFPISVGVTNSWGAREAWMKQSPIEGEDWGPREYRGPLWEAVTGLIAAIAGADLLMMLHPLAIKSMKDAFESLAKRSEEVVESIEEWEVAL